MKQQPEVIHCSRCGAELAVIKAASVHTVRLVCDSCTREIRIYEMKCLTPRPPPDKVRSF